MMDVRKVFLAGTMQGANRGTEVSDQSYRTTIPALVRSSYPQAICFDPSADVARQLGDPAITSMVKEMIAAAPPVIHVEALPPQIGDLRDTFHRMTLEVEKCDLCIAYLPDGALSMGTAMEMYAAWRAGVPVVAVTELVQNLAILSVSDWILRDLDALATWLVNQSEMSART
jgi:hypothetical protein